MIVLYIGDNIPSKTCVVCIFKHNHMVTVILAQWYFRDYILPISASDSLCMWGKRYVYNTDTGRVCCTVVLSCQVFTWSAYLKIIVANCTGGMHYICDNSTE